MSKDIVDIICNYANKNKYPVMIIASRNQVDYDSGYVATTKQLFEQTKLYKSENILVCRDHCGPYFSDADRGLPLATALTRCKATINTDIMNGMDLIHIDVSRIPENQLEYGKELIEFAISRNPNINAGTTAIINLK